MTDDRRLLNLERGFLYTLHLLASSWHLAPGPDEYDVASTMADYHALLSEPGASGVAVAAANVDVVARYLEFRRATDRHVAAYAENLACKPETIRSTYSLFTCESKPIRDVTAGSGSKDGVARTGAHQ